ncbi:MAG: TIGR01777 family oxidoreductase [Gammaproteobacteria bacterium]|nr:TIGR01777 family oxidoreductase [Gammaproteobacteria bacterium]
MKHYLITGGTGLIGSALCRILAAENNQITVLSRNPSSVEQKCGDDIKAIQCLNDIDDDTNIDVVINLAGEPIADKLWTKKRKTLLEQSRIDTTRCLVDWLISRQQKPECLISGSAVGWYGDGGDRLINEQSQFHQEYTHSLCEAWEQQAIRAGQNGIRVCIVRTGLVLAPNGGFLQKMLLPFRMGLGGRLGNGQQYMPWIHIDDMVSLLTFLVENEQLKGVFNACSPSPVTNSEFTKTLAALLNRPAFFHVPASFLRLLLGEMARLLLTGQRAIPAKLEANRFKFNYTDLESALSNILKIAMTK